MPISALKSSLRHKLFLIYALNLADWLCTALLLRSGRFYEANPLARLFIHSLPLSCALKLVFPAVVIAVVLRLSRQLDEPQLRRVEMFVCFSLTFYTALCIDHIVNFALLFFVQGA